MIGPASSAVSRPSARSRRTLSSASSGIVRLDERQTGRVVGWVDTTERSAAVERLEPASRLCDIDLAAFEGAEHTESRVLVGGGDRAVAHRLGVASASDAVGGGGGSSGLGGAGGTGGAGGASVSGAPLRTGTGRTTLRSPDIERNVTSGPLDPMARVRWPRAPSIRPWSSELMSPDIVAISIRTSPAGASWASPLTVSTANGPVPLI